jgi:cardiolipin synthase
VWLVITDQKALAFWVFVAAGVSDGIDGALARWLKARTELGAWLDPMADKALLVGIFVALGTVGQLPLWLVILAVSRDVFIVGGILALKAMEVPETRIRPSAVSKLHTFLQIVLAGVALADDAFGPDLTGWVGILVWMVAATTVVSALVYAARVNRRLDDLKETR